MIIIDNDICYHPLGAGPPILKICEQKILFTFYI